MNDLRRRAILAGAADFAVVVIFVLVGRRTHQQSGALGATLGALWPFVAALALGWALTRAWHAPAQLWRGLAIWAVTLTGGMLGRAFIMNQGTATAFVLVAAGFTAAGLIGWRLIATLVTRRR